MALINIALCESSQTLKETSSAARTRGRDAVSIGDRGPSREEHGNPAEAKSRFSTRDYGAIT